MPHVYDDQIDGPRHLWPVEPRPRPIVHAPPVQPAHPFRLRTLLLWIAGIMLVGWAASKSSTFRQAPDLPIRIGMPGVVTRGGPRAPQLDMVPLLLDDDARNTTNGIPRNPLAGVTVQLAPGTSVRMFEAGSRGTLIEVSQGAYLGRVGWVPRGYAWPESLPPSMTGLRAARRIN